MGAAENAIGALSKQGQAYNFASQLAICIKACEG